MEDQSVGPEGRPVQPLDLSEDASSPDARTRAKPPINPFRDLWLGGYRRLVPIVPPLAELSPHSSLFKRPGGRGKAVGELGQHGWRGFDWLKHVTTEDDLERWSAMGAGVGCRMGEGLVAIDIDALDQELSLAAMNAAFELFGPAPRRIGRAPKMLLLYRCTADVPYQRVDFKGADGSMQRVEVLGPGQQAVFIGTHPVTMKPYRWPDGLPARDELPEITSEQMSEFFNRLLAILPEAVRPSAPNGLVRGDVDQDKLVGPLEDIRAAVAAIPNDRSDRAWYLRMAYGIKAALRDHPEEAFDIFWEWVEPYVHKDGTPKDYAATWSFWTSLQPPFTIGAPFIFGEASQITGKNMAPAKAYFDVVPEGSVDTSAFQAPRTAVSKKPALKFIGLGECAASALTGHARPLIKGLLDQGAMSVLYGESNVGKTFVAMDMAYHIAKGLPWGGMKTTQKRVAYVAAEGGRGAHKRSAALVRKYGPCEAFHLLLRSVDLLRADADLQPLIEALKELGGDLGLVVLDTLSRAMAGGDENSSTDMGALVRHLDAIREATGAHVMVVHHSGKNRALGARGHSLLRAATDTEIEVSEGQIAATKQRDLDKSYASAFELEVVTLGQDEEGDAVTSCTLRLVAKRVDLTPGIATPGEQEVLDALSACTGASANPRAYVSQAEIVASLGLPTSKAEGVRAHLRKLRTKNLVEKCGQGRWRTTCPNRMTEDGHFEPQNPESSLLQSGGSPVTPYVFQ